MSAKRIKPSVYLPSQIRQCCGINSIAKILFQSPITIIKRKPPYCLSVKHNCRLRHNLSDKQIIQKMLSVYFTGTANNCQK